MGVGELEILKRLKAAGYIPDNGSIIEIGAQQLNDSLLSAAAEIEEAKSLFGIDQPVPAFARSADRDPNNILHGAPLARDFWTWLGFDYASVDIDGTPGSIPLDLNFDEAPADARGKYHLVTNLGTTEHAVNQMQAFKIIHDLTAVDGIMLHNVPMGGMFTHGLISYNPKFFWMLARANGYKTAFMTLSANNQLHPVPDDIMTKLSRSDASLPIRFADYRSIECAIIVALQKQLDVPFVPPLDVRDGTTTDHAELKSRYWSIFQSNPFSKRETELIEREAGICQREQALANEEHLLAGRKRAVWDREHAVDDIETTARNVTLEREQALAAAEEALTVRKKAVWTREQVVAERELRTPRSFFDFFSTKLRGRP